MPDIKMPDGQVVRFPDDMDKSEIKSLIQKKYPDAFREQTVNETANVALGSFIEGVPIVGPYIREGADRVGAGARALINDTRFSDELDFVQGRTRQLQKENPVLDTTAQIAGGVAGMVPAVAAAPGLFGAGAGGLAGRSVASGLSGAAIGGGDAAVRSGGDLTSTAIGAGAGLTLGALAPSVAKGAGALYNRAMGRTAPTKADKLLSKAMQRDDLAPDEAMARLRAMGDDAVPADLGPNLRQRAEGLASMEGPAQQVVRSSLKARDAGANARITGAIDDALGPATVPSQVDDTIRAGQRALGPEYDRVFANAKAVDTSDLALTLDAAAVNVRGPAQNAVRKVRDMLNVAGTDQLDPNPATLHQVRQAIDGMVTATKDTNAVRALTAARQSIDDTLARSVPGIKEVDAKFAELARQSEALQRGQQVLDSGRTAPRPQELAQAVEEGVQPQGLQVGPSAAPFRLSQGARAEIDRIVGTNANDRVALQRVVKGEGDWNRARLATLFGEDKADRILRVLSDEKTFSETSQQVLYNSRTAPRQQAMEELGARGGTRDKGVMRNALNIQMGDAVANVGDRIGRAFNRPAIESRNEALAKALMDKAGGSEFAQSIKRLKNVPDNTRINSMVEAMTIGGGSNYANRRPLELTIHPHQKYMQSR